MAAVPTTRSAPDVTSTSRLVTSLGATAVIIALLGGTVYLLATRFLDLRDATGQLVWRVSDLFLVLLVILSLIVLAKLVTQTRPPGRLRILPSPVRSRVRALVETSLFGVGSRRGWTETNPAVGLDKLMAPGPLSDYDYEPEGLDEADGANPTGPRVGTVDFRVEPEATSVLSSKSALDPKDLVVHEVARGETFWSLAESTLGDGLRWVEIRDANLGREVAPGHELVADDLLVRGWSILVPKPIVDAGPAPVGTI